MKILAANETSVGGDGSLGSVDVLHGNNTDTSVSTNEFGNLKIATGDTANLNLEIDIVEGVALAMNINLAHENTGSQVKFLLKMGGNCEVVASELTVIEI